MTGDPRCLCGMSRPGRMPPPGGRGLCPKCDTPVLPATPPPDINYRKHHEASRLTTRTALSSMYAPLLALALFALPVRADDMPAQPEPRRCWSTGRGTTECTDEQAREVQLKMIDTEKALSNCMSGNRTCEASLTACVAQVPPEPPVSPVTAFAAGVGTTLAFMLISLLLAR